MSDPIRITQEELRDPHVDEEIARQQSFGFAVRGADEKPIPLYMRPWLALMTAGALGALAAWGLTEPFMDDGVRFNGRVESIAVSDLPEEAEFPRLVVIGGLRVLLHRQAVILDTADEVVPADTLAAGDSVEVLAVISTVPDGAKVLTSHFIRKVEEVPAGEGTIDLDRVETRDTLVGYLIFPLLAGLVGMLIGATDGVLSRAWSRAALTSTVSLGVGAVGGVLGSLVAGLLYAMGEGVVWRLHEGESLHPTGLSLVVQIMSRGLAWTVIGACAGLGQGMAMRSRRLLLNGLVGGTIGGLMGGVLFDPVNLALEDVYRSGGAEISRLVGYVVIGAAIGLMIGLVEFATREAWVRLLTGPIAGKEFILYRNPTWIGSSPKCEIYLFKDALVSPRHACIRRTGDGYEIDDQGAPSGTLVSGQRVRTRRLRDHERLQIGQTSMEFRLRDE